MKNLFKNISQEEKNRILEMHTVNKNLIKEDGVSMDNNTNKYIKDFIKMVTSTGFKHDPLTKINPALFYSYQGKPLVFVNGREDLPATIWVFKDGKGITAAGYYGTENFNLGPIDNQKVKVWCQQQFMTKEKLYKTIK